MSSISDSHIGNHTVQCLKITVVYKLSRYEDKQ